MNKIIIILLSICLLTVLLPNTMATPGPATGECDDYRHQSVIAIALAIQVGDNEIWGGLNGNCSIMHSNTQAVVWTGQYSGPIILAASTVTWAVGTAFVGCTIGAIAVVTNTILGNAGSVASALVTMTSNECHGTITFTISITGIYTWNAILPVNLRVEATTMNVVNSGTVSNLDYLCAATQGTPNAFNSASTTCLDPQINNFNYLCDAPAITPDAFNPATTVCNDLVLSGSFALTGTVTNPSCLTTNTCSFALSGTLNVVNSGGQNIAITSWPALLATLSGGVTITDDANGWIIHQDPLSGTVNVVNSGTQHIIVDSWPTLNAALSGSLTITDTTQCTAALPCHLVLDSATGTFNVVNSGSMTNTLTGNVNVHQDEACGAIIHCKVDMTCLSGTCQSSFSGNVTSNSTMSNNFILGVLPYNLLLFAIAFFAVAAESRGDVLYWVICLILSIVLLVVRPIDSIVPTPFFIGWIFVVLYQMISLLSNGRARNLSGEEQEN